MHRAQFVLPMVVAGLLIGEADVQASQYRHLCTSTQACTFTPAGVPLLDADVCYNSTGAVTLKGTSDCAVGSWPYYVDYGEVVDPVTSEVAAYIPLDDACNRPGLCVKGPPPPGAQEQLMCCLTDSQGTETCYNGGTCGGSLWFCHDGVCNEDGTVTCFKKEGL